MLSSPSIHGVECASQSAKTGAAERPSLTDRLFTSHASQSRMGGDHGWRPLPTNGTSTSSKPFLHRSSGSSEVLHSSEPMNPLQDIQEVPAWVPAIEDRDRSRSPSQTQDLVSTTASAQTEVAATMPRVCCNDPWTTRRPCDNHATTMWRR